MNRNANGRGADTPPSRAFVRRLLVLFILLAGFLLYVPFNTYPALQRIDQPFVERPFYQAWQGFNSLDGSWQTNYPAALSEGRLAGRDFVFTYGPVFQLLRDFGRLVPPGDFASVYRFQRLPEALLLALGLWLALSLTGAPLGWRAVCYFAWILALEDFAWLKPMAGPFLVAACAAALVASGEKARAAFPLKAVLLWALTPVLLTLYAFDVGVCALASLLLTAGAVWVFTLRHPGRQAAETRGRVFVCAAATVLGFVVFGLVLFLVPGWGSYLKDSWELAAGYSFTLADKLIGRALLLYAVALAGALAVLLLSGFQLRAAWRADDAAGQRRTLALVAAACFGVIWLRTGLTRSDMLHVVWSLAPALFLFAALLPCRLRAEGRRLAWPALAAALLVLFAFNVRKVHLAYPLAVLTEAPAAHRWLSQHAWAARQLDLSGARLEVGYKTVGEAAAAARELPEGKLYVWPFETVVADIAGKTNVAYTLQSYAATTDRLEQATVARLQANGDAPVLLFTDSYPIDKVENLTRTPRIFRFLTEHYELAGARHETFLILRRRAGGERPWREKELATGAGVLTPGGERSLRVNLDAASPDEECRASDLLSLRVRAAKTLMLGVRKPGDLWLTFFLSNGEQRTQKILVPPDGEPHDVLASALTLNDPLFPSFFSARRLWRAAERVTALELRWSPMDALSVAPREVAIERLAVLRRDGAEVLETPLSRQAEPALRGWCYEGAPPPDPSAKAD